jgi:type I restriction enzyme S subunit
MSKWPMVALKELMGDRIESVDPSKHPDELFDLYSVPSFDQRVPEKCFGSEVGSSKKLVQPGDVLLSRIVPHIRRSWVVTREDGRRLIASGEWIVFRSSRIDPAWLCHILVGDTFHAQFMQTVAGVGGSLMRARPNQVASIRIPVPPIEEQRRIAAILDQANKLGAKQRRALEALSALREASFLATFGDPARNPKCWPLVQLGTMVESCNYGTSEKASTSGTYPVLRMNNITYQGEIDMTDLKYMELSKDKVNRYTVRDGDILFNRTNSADLVGKTAVYRGCRSVAFAGYLIRLRVAPGNEPDYISAFLNSRYGKTVLRSMCKSIIGMANINAQEIQSIKIPHPPSELQKKFADSVRMLAAAQSRYRSSLTQLDALFASLQARAFAGEL